MPVPTAYSESQLAAYLTSVLDSLAAVLGWDASDPRVREAVTDALLEYGESDISTITGGTNLRRLRALGRRAIWRAVAASTAGYYSFTDVATQKFDRQQVHEHATEMLALAETDCLEFSPIYAATILSVAHPHDPYVVIPDEDRVA